MERLSSIEKRVYQRYVKEKIIERCKSLKLPLFIQSTAVAFWSRFPQNNINVVISLACKANDRSIEIGVCDMELAEALNYDFHQPSPYLRMYGLVIILQERAIVECVEEDTEAESGNDNAPVRVDLHFLWSQSIRNMEKALLLDQSVGVNEMAVAALDLPPRLLHGVVKADWAVIDKIKKEIGEMKPLDRTLLQVVLQKTNIGDIIRDVRMLAG